MNKSTRLIPSFLIAAAFAVFLLSAARADEADTTTLKFSDPAKPGTLKITVANGDIHVSGTDAAEITVRTELKPEKPVQRKDGLRVLTSSASYSLTEKDNVAHLTYGTGGWPSNAGDFDITVPRNTSIVIANTFGGDISIGEVTGDIEIKSLNGEVHLSDVAGGALVETMNGEIHCNLRELHDGHPISFTSMNGEVQLRLPDTLKANVRLRTHNGSILTDFDAKQLVTKTASLTPDGRAPRALGAQEAAEIREQVRHAVRIGMEAAKEAARAARDAVRDADHDSADNEDHDDDTPEAPPAPDVAPVPPVPPLPPMTGGKIVTGTLNGGGPEIRISTMNGDVTLRKIEAASAPSK
ncbi:MAG TPA: DUF4097 family beta strand repeat-containing protein [Opitutus sp.]|nr:DUF4097 family beta strand repeat-containing protein [Opitutus sp.]